MKKLVLTLGICLAATVCFGQKKNVADALKIAKDPKGNIEDARSKIKEALTNAETKDDPKTWFTAGQIENLQFDKENTKQILGQQPNEAVMYTALYNIYPYFEKAFEMDLKPDAKGKVKPKYVKDMKSILKANLIYFMNGGIYYNDNNNNKKTFEFFDQYVTISDSPLMKYGETASVPAAIDSNYIYAVYYAFRFVTELDDYETIINTIKRGTKQEFQQDVAYQYLAQAYQNAGDIENYKKTLVDGLSLFPNEPFFLINMVNIYIESDEHDKALNNTLKAIQVDPDNAQLYNVAGFIHEKIGEKDKDYSKAEEFWLKSIALDSEYEEPYANLGRIYFNQAVAQLEIANEIADVRKYNEEVEKAKTFFRKAQPFYEKAFQLNSKPIDTKIALRNIYYHLGMGDKFAEIDALMEQ